MGNKEKNFISAVIYVHNAQTRIGEFLKNILQVLENNFEQYEIICVDDFSEDQSVSAIKQAGKLAEHAGVSILHMSSFHGVEAAMSAGVSLSIGDFVLEFDQTDQDFDNEVIMKVYQKSLEGYDIVSASPKCSRKMTSNLFYTLFNKAAHFTNKIRTESFRILSRRVLNRISSMNKSVPYRKAVYANCGLPMFQLEYEPSKQFKKNLNQINQTDKKEKNYRWNLAVDTLILFTQAGYQAAFTITLLMMFVAVFMAVYSVFVYVTSTPVAGWMTMILFMSFAFFGLFGILTVIIKYLQILVNLVFKKKDYNFGGIEKL